MKRNILKTILCGVMVTMIGASFVGCNSKDESSNLKISISGSTSVGPAMDKLGAEYMKSNENVNIEVNQTGSSAGIKDVISGISDIGMASRDLKDEEATTVNGTEIAYDGIAVILNTENKVETLTKEQIKDIYTGKITNWSEVGGSDSPIVVVSREEGSGTRTAFQEVLGYKSEELTKDASIADGSGNIKTTVKGNKNAVGFVSFEYLDDTINAVSVDSVAPSKESVKDKTYSLSRSFLVVTHKDGVSEGGQEFIDWILSEEGQVILEESGAIRIK